MEKEKSRVDWVDIYKAIGILLVVVGHTTGNFNNYIYQFHMAAFFLISGYTTNLQKDTVRHYIYKKIYRLYIPLLSITVIGAAVMAFFYRIKFYNYVYDPEIYRYIGSANTIKKFLIYGDNYVWWLGATWFIFVLFQIEVLEKILFYLCSGFKRTYVWYALITVILYILGYYCVHRNILRFKMFDLVLIGQVYFGTGQIIRKMGNVRINGQIHLKKLVFGVVISYVYLFLIKKYAVNYTVDYPSREFHNIYLNYISGVVGSLLLYSCSKIIEMYGKKIKLLLKYIGKNTFGIIAFHFLAYSLAYSVLAVSGICVVSKAYEISTSDFEKGWWILWVVYAILFSIVLWEMLTRSVIGKVLFGKSIIWERVWESIKRRTYSYNERMSVAWKNRIKRIVVLSGIGATIMFAAYISVQSGRSLDITFPYEGVEKVLFDEGWLSQRENEKYRWIKKVGEVSIKKGKWEKIYISGYVPENFIEVNNVKIEINGIVVFETDLKNRKWEYSSNLIKNIKYGEEIHIKIEYDDIHLPDAQSDDIRELSGMINEIRFN